MRGSLDSQRGRTPQVENRCNIAETGISRRWQQWDIFTPRSQTVSHRWAHFEPSHSSYWSLYYCLLSVKICTKCRMLMTEWVLHSILLNHKTRDTGEGTSPANSPPSAVCLHPNFRKTITAVDIHCFNNKKALLLGNLLLFQELESWHFGNFLSNVDFW